MWIQEDEGLAFANELLHLIYFQWQGWAQYSVPGQNNNLGHCSALGGRQLSPGFARAFFNLVSLKNLDLIFYGVF